MSPRRPPVPSWTVVETKYSFRDQWVGLRSDTVVLANGHMLSPYHIMEFPNWTNVVAITPEFDIVLVEEYRHGGGRPFIELPSGAVDGNEDPQVAARRELLEETGYSGPQWHTLGTFFANPARQNNRVFTYLAMDVRQTAKPVLGEGEIIQTHTIAWADFVADVDRFEFPGLQLAALHLLQLYAMRSEDPRVRQLCL